LVFTGLTYVLWQTFCFFKISGMADGISNGHGRILGLLIVIGVGLVGLLAILNAPGGAALLRIPELPGAVFNRLQLLQTLVGLTLIMALLLLYRKRRLAGSSTLTMTLGVMFTLWFALMSGITTLSWTLKGAYKGFSAIASEINDKLDSKLGLSVVRDSRDEYFDPLLYYIGREVTLHPPERLELSCPGFILARRSWVESLPSEQISGADVVLKTAEWRLIQSGAAISPERELLLLACRQ
jgi:hypothetical protein